MRVGLHTRLRPGSEGAYDAAHRAVPPALEAAIRAAGAHDWTIWRSGLDLFHVLDCDDYADLLATLEREPVNVAWQARMGELLDVAHDYSAAGATSGLPVVWQLPPAPAPDFRGHVMGAAALGGLYREVSADQGQDALTTAWDGGVRAFDTAPHYGVGLSEERLGAFLRTKPRAEYVVSTKVGRILVDDPAAPDGVDMFFGTPRRSRIRDYSAEGIRRSHADSLVRLGLDRVDVLLVHDPEQHMAAALTEAVPELVRMRAEGVIGGFGVGTNFTDVATEFAVTAPIDRLMIAGRYSLLDRRAEVGVLAACADRGIDVLVAGVFNSGLLADPWRRTTFDYGPAPQHLLDAARAMHRACERHGVSLRAAALQFPLRHRAVSAVVSGAGSAATVADVLTQLTVPIPDELWPELDALVPDLG